MASASIPSANVPAMDLILVYTVQLKTMIKGQVSGRMVSSSINDVAFASIHSEKTHLKNLIMIIIIIKNARISGFCLAAKMDFQRLLAGHRNMRLEI